MTHLVMYKFKPGEYKEEYKTEAEEVFGKLKDLNIGITKVRIESNCFKRDVNYDLLVMIDVTNEDALNTYLTHPLHKGFSKKMDDFIVSKARMDF